MGLKVFFKLSFIVILTSAFIPHSNLQNSEIKGYYLAGDFNALYRISQEGDDYFVSVLEPPYPGKGKNALFEKRFKMVQKDEKMIFEPVECDKLFNFNGREIYEKNKNNPQDLDLKSLNEKCIFECKYSVSYLHRIENSEVVNIFIDLVNHNNENALKRINRLSSGELDSIHVKILKTVCLYELERVSESQIALDDIKNDSCLADYPSVEFIVRRIEYNINRHQKTGVDTMDINKLFQAISTVSQDSEEERILLSALLKKEYCSNELPVINRYETNSLSVLNVENWAGSICFRASMEIKAGNYEKAFNYLKAANHFSDLLYKGTGENDKYIAASIESKTLKVMSEYLFHVQQDKNKLTDLWQYYIKIENKTTEFFELDTDYYLNYVLLPEDNRELIHKWHDTLAERRLLIGASLVYYNKVMNNPIADFNSGKIYFPGDIKFIPCSPFSTENVKVYTIDDYSCYLYCTGYDNKILRQMIS